VSDEEMTALLPELPVPCSKSAVRLPRTTDAIVIGVRYAAPCFERSEIFGLSGVAQTTNTPEWIDRWYRWTMATAGLNARDADNEFAGQ
jgi:hypothetical protein